MQKCSYCGRENEDAATSCVECGTPLSEVQPPFGLVTPHRMLGEVQRGIWEHFAVKRPQFYLAGLLIGLLAGLIGALRSSEQKFPLWALPTGAAVGLGAVWLLSLAEKTQARIDRARVEGNPTGGLLALFVVFLLVAALVVALLVAGVAEHFH